ncbi:MAG: peptidoglycan DD-metalloendopeptidase family protein [Roseiflexaceae bacterium]|nr:peptidoglycan DD-metalloendopeptidase family protein [Roseiflexaceae bacterium]
MIYRCATLAGASPAATDVARYTGNSPVAQSSRDRLRARRQAIAARRRRLIIPLIVAALLAVAVLFWLSRPRQAVAPQLAAPSAQALIQAGAPTAPPAVAPTPSGPAQFFHDQRLTYAPGFYVPEVQAFLDAQPGPLKTFSTPVGDRSHSFAEIVVGQSLYYSLNPQVVLALLESQAGLLSAERPSQQQLDWAMGYRTKDAKPGEDKLRGLTAQVRWAVRQLLYARRDFAAYPPLVFQDGTQSPAPAGWELSRYALARALAPATTPDQLDQRLMAFAATYTRLFGDPRPAPEDWPAPAAPFLSWPLEKPARITSFFDHDGPFLGRSGGTFSYWGRNEPDLSYDGHDGWDYASAFEPALAAAAGTVVFAGNADDNCATTAVVLDHGNGYRTLYWHLSSANVANGQQVGAGDALGITGASGCAFGPHLHLGVQYLGRSTDPYGYCGATADPWAQNPAGSASRWLWQDRPSPCGPPPAGALLVDTASPGFSNKGIWQTAPFGYGGDALFTRSVGEQPAAAATATPAATPLAPTVLAPTASASYRPQLTAGRYRVLAYIPYVLNGLDDAIGVTYRVTHAGGTSARSVDLQLHANEWLDLGTYEFAPGSAAVEIGNRAEFADQGVWADAVLWLPVEQ